jgi:hypothetical protein
LGNIRLVPSAIAGSEAAWRVEVVSGQEKPHPQGWYSRSYNSAEPSPTGVFRAKIEGDATFVWLFVTANGEVPAAGVEIEAVEGDVATVVVTLPEGKVRVTLPLAGDSRAKVEGM